MAKKYQYNGKRVRKSRRYIVTHWGRMQVLLHKDDPPKPFNLEDFADALKTLYNNDPPIKKNRKLIGRRLKRYNEWKKKQMQFVSRPIFSFDKFPKGKRFVGGITVTEPLTYFTGNKSIRLDEL